MFIHKQNYELQCAVNCSERRQCAYKVAWVGANTNTSTTQPHTVPALPG